MSREKEYICKDYRKKPEFASFLPGIAGITGIPLWCYYVNRGQGVVSFGSDNKDNAIMEFYPAHVAYQRAGVTGFRTFLRAEGKYLEPFSDPEVPHEMRIRMNSFDVAERDEVSGLETQATYFILPEEDFGALVRRVTITNLTDRERELEIVDGMPALIPYGVNNETMKEMTQLAKAWMQVEDAQTGVPFFRVRASMEDTASVQEVKGGNFCLALDEAGESLPVLVDARVLFGYDSSLQQARVFKESGLEGVLAGRQAFSNQIPCAFFTARRRLRAGESFTFYELYGHADSKETLREVTGRKLTAAYLEAKYRRAGEITDALGDTIDTRTGDANFNAYSRYTYMDNVLRGGYPVEAGGKVFYVYSRKHGDLEREYNYFSMSPEPCSQGNGNFRDVNQNRRCDPFFTPQAGRRNIRLFYDLIQPDGYNPLSVEKITYTLKQEKCPLLAEQIAELLAGCSERGTESSVTEGQRDEKQSGQKQCTQRQQKSDKEAKILECLCSLPAQFTPGELYLKLESSPEIFADISADMLTMTISQASFLTSKEETGKIDKTDKTGETDTASITDKADKIQVLGTVFAMILASCDEQENASFKEGYWSDHWTYNLDLVEEYLGIWPEQEEDLLTEKVYTWYQPEAFVVPRAQRYAETENGVRQYHAVTPAPDARPGQRVQIPVGQEILSVEECTTSTHDINKYNVSEFAASEQTVNERYTEGNYTEGHYASANDVSKQIAGRTPETEPYKSTILEKLTALCALKTATLDPMGMGVEMEGGKPGWYDALNGLPGLLGSSMTESCELARMLRFTIRALRKYPGKLEVFTELGELLQNMDSIFQREISAHSGTSRSERDMNADSGIRTDTYINTDNNAAISIETPKGINRDIAAERDRSVNKEYKADKDNDEGDIWPQYLARWHRLNDAKEQYRARVYAGLSGEVTVLDREGLADILSRFLEAVEDGIERSIRQSASGIIPAYFYYEVTDYEKDEEGIHIRDVACRQVPDYLEGPVRYLKLPLAREQKSELYRRVRESALYDRKLSMYKVNASLADASYEIGRVKCFTPGWLENESIWLHMEYKYLLELLRSGLYGEFAEDFHKAAVPFMDEETYGRSILENSSFIVSSANPDESLHGRGFVARLSGSTAEFLSIWQIMMFGEKPFWLLEDDALAAQFSPAIPAYLIGDDLTVSARFMGHTQVTYHFAEKRDHFPGNYQVERITLMRAEATNAREPQGTTEKCPDASKRIKGVEEYVSGQLTGAAAEALRAGAYRQVDIYIR